MRTKKIKNDRSAAANIFRWLRMQRCSLGDVHLVMDATGVYHDNFALFLHEAGAYVSLANPRRISGFAKGMGTLTKKDKVDAYMLFCYALLKKSQRWVPPKAEVRHLSAPISRRDALMSDATIEKRSGTSVHGKAECLKPAHPPAARKAVYGRTLCQTL